MSEPAEGGMEVGREGCRQEGSQLQALGPQSEAGRLQCSPHTIEVGSRGVPHMAGFCRLKKLGLTQTELSSLLSHISHKAVEGVFWQLVLKEQSDLDPQ